MKFLNEKIYFIFFLVLFLLANKDVLAKDGEIIYTKENISNYFSGIVSVQKNHNDKALKYFKKVKLLKDSHSEFNIEYLRTLVLLGKYDEALRFSENVWDEKELFFESDLLLGLNYFLEKDYKNSEKHFRRLNKISRYNLFFEDFIGNVLIAWSRASQGKKDESFSYIEKIPKPYDHLTKTQNSFLHCYFDTEDAQISLEEIIRNKEYNFSRYNFFLANYFLSKNDNIKATNIIRESREKYSSNLLLKETEYLLLNKKYKKITNFYNCNNPNDSLAEFFYVIANLYSSEKDFQLSNFYLKISHFLNDRFITNNALLAENFFFQKKYNEAKNVYMSLKSIGPTYSWYASKNIASILGTEKTKKDSVKSLEKEFKRLRNPNYEHYYELANFYKENEYFKESVKYYSQALDKINKNHSLVSKIYDRRGTSYERLGEWENAEKDLVKSLEISPDDAHVLNYLAYSWIDQGVNLDKGLEMLKKANEIRKGDGYIIDSLGWAYYAKKNYAEAEKFLQKAVELLPADPVINDHYADALWMLDKNIQARYIWKNILELEQAEEKLKSIIKKKLVFGIEKKNK